MFLFDQSQSIATREEKILKFWQERRIFEKSVEERAENPPFTFYDGPPFATGLPHYGHLLAGTIKDVVPRYKTMKGFYVPRRFGWDCHGLPVENEIEKAKELSGSSAIEAFGIAAFNEECRSIVLRYTSEWKKTVERMGRWVDFSQTYHTMDKEFMETVWWVFQELFNQGLVYEGFKVMPFSMKLGTPLSNFEANLNYKDVDDPSIVVAFQLEEDPEISVLAWTTTPWTLPSNLALMVGKDLEYVLLKESSTNKKYILAKERVKTYFKDEGVVLENFKGAELQNKRYRPLFPFFKDHPGAFRILLEDSVSMEEGTGVVHAAPAFGEVDFFACKREGIEIVCPVDANGYFTELVPPYKGVLVKDADKELMRDLKKQGSLFYQGTIRHRYPFCWRSDTPLIYKAVRTWFVSVEKIKQELIASNAEIDWVPGHIKEGRFGKWLENARDWAISRNRYWGTPIPIWRNKKGDLHVIGSVKELEGLTGAKVNDLHRHFIDELTFVKQGEVYHRIPEVFDCWFESGSMPYAQMHYPFENKETFHTHFPADFIAEGLDQTRGWFYTLNILSTALFKKPAFKHVIVNGIILAEDGNKMSKRLKNYPDPDVVIQSYGADAVRLYMLHSAAVQADDLRFSEKGVEHVVRQVLIPFWNAFVFLSTYAKIYAWTPQEVITPPKARIDAWILSLTQKLILDVEKGMETYELSQAVNPFVAFVDQLTNWYIRRCRHRFWADEDSLDRREAFATLYTVLLQLVKVAAPFIPFISEAIYQELKTEHMPESVHLANFPEYQKKFRQIELEEETQGAQIAVSLGHGIRKEQKIKVRQPLRTAHLISVNTKRLDALRKEEAVIADELNVKQLVFHTDESGFVEWSVKPNFPILGKKVGKYMPMIQKKMQQLDKNLIADLFSGKMIRLQIDEHIFDIQPEDVQIERQAKLHLAAANQGDLTIVLETYLDEELLIEGLARELINKINTMRRELSFYVTDRILVTIQTTDRVQAAYTKYKEHIDQEVLAIGVDFRTCEGTEWDLNGEKAILHIQAIR